MRKLNPPEQSALRALANHEPYCPGTDASSAGHDLLRSTLDSLVKKKRVAVDVGDDGPVYRLTAIGRDEIQ